MNMIPVVRKPVAALRAATERRLALEILPSGKTRTVEAGPPPPPESGSGGEIPRRWRCL